AERDGTHGRRAVDTGTVSELTLGTAAPATDSAVGADHARVLLAAADGDAVRSVVEQRRPVRPHGRRLVARRRDADLAVGVVAPATERRVSARGAGVVVPDPERDDAVESGDGHRDRSVDERAVAELAREVVAPAAHVPVGPY